MSRRGGRDWACGRVRFTAHWRRHSSPFLLRVFAHQSTRWTPRVLALDQPDSNSKSPNPKSETNSKARKSKIQDLYSWEAGGVIRVFFFSNLGFVSDFEFRVSDFSARPAVSSRKVMGHVQV